MAVLVGVSSKKVSEEITGKSGHSMGEKRSDCRTPQLATHRNKITHYGTFININLQACQSEILLTRI